MREPADAGDRVRNLAGALLGKRDQLREGLDASAGLTAMNIGLSVANPIGAKSRGNSSGMPGVTPGCATKADRAGM